MKTKLQQFSDELNTLKRPIINMSNQSIIWNDQQQRRDKILKKYPTPKKFRLKKEITI